MSKKRLVAATTGDGRITVIEQDIPAVGKGTVLVKVRASLVSPGTELGGWRKLAEAKKNPKPGAQLRPFGYSNAGVVEAAGEGVAEFKPGDRVACIGGGFALHGTYAVVPHHLCVALPGTVTFAQGSYAMLAATAMHALRRAEPELGEFTAAVGLGALGQLCAQLYQLAGNYVVGWDLIDRRLEIARKWGITETARADKDVVEATRRFTGGRGLDGAVVALGGGDAGEAIANIGRCMKVAPDGHAYGRIVVVGNPSFEYRAHESLGMTNVDIRRASRTGPGYHDAAWETGGAYPPVFMRWTTRTNLELCMRLIGEGRLKVDALTTHTIPLADVEKRIDAIIDRPDEMLGVVFEM